MPVISLPYGKKHIEANIPDSRFNGCLVSKMTEYVPEKSETELVRDALAHPIGTPRLSDMAIGKKNIVIISSDHTRPVPSKVIIPLLLEEIRKSSPAQRGETIPDQWQSQIFVRLMERAGVPLGKGILLTVIKVGLGMILGILVNAVWGPGGIFTLTPLAVVGAVSILSINDGPFFCGKCQTRVLTHSVKQSGFDVKHTVIFPPSLLSAFA